MIERVYKVYSLSIEELKTLLAKKFKVNEDDVTLEIKEYSNDFGDHDVSLKCEVKVEVE